MAFNGYLIKIGSYSFPLEYMEEKSYSAKVNTLDLDPYNDTDGVLHRNVIQRVPKVTFKTMPMNNIKFDEIMGNIIANYKIEKERKATMDVYVPEWGRYERQDMYISDMDIAIDYINGNTVEYSAITFTMTSYGKKGG